MTARHFVPWPPVLGAECWVLDQVANQPTASLSSLETEAKLFASDFLAVKLPHSRFYKDHGIKIGGMTKPIRSCCGEGTRLLAG